MDGGPERSGLPLLLSQIDRRSRGRGSIGGNQYEGPRDFNSAPAGDGQKPGASLEGNTVFDHRVAHPLLRFRCGPERNRVEVADGAHMPRLLSHTGYFVRLQGGLSISGFLLEWSYYRVSAILVYNPSPPPIFLLRGCVCLKKRSCQFRKSFFGVHFGVFVPPSPPLTSPMSPRRAEWARRFETSYSSNRRQPRHSHLVA
ncbi:hypothetical protein LZ30DRAFT_734887 [Colletotrichum cereale]|nr:hypothetical protein LZ30DRAFT_734887 [Colletotrichum cereale]